MARLDGSRRKLIEFTGERWQALESLARDRMATIQELADEAFRDLLEKHQRPETLGGSLKMSARARPANEAGTSRPKSGRSKRRK